MSLVVWVLLGVVLLVVAARVRALVRPRAFPPWLTPILEWPGRDRERILERAGLAEGERVLELGPGGGWITERAVERVGPRGRVVCLDLQRGMLEKVRARLGDAALLVQASGSALPFRDGAFDRAFLVRVLGEIPDRRAALADLRRVLRSGGELAVAEGITDPDYVRAPVLRRLAERAGLRVGERHGSFADYTQRLGRP